MFESPHLIDAVMLFAVFEAVALILWRQRFTRGPTPGAITRMILPGLFLLFALRQALAGEAWPYVPLALIAALLAHAADLYGRWQD